jgi:hypothetical protein
MALTVTSEGPLRITKATVEAAWRRRVAGQRLVIRDLECRGLALVVNATAMAWVYSYKPRGQDPLTGRRFPTRSVTIGGPASHSPEDARTAANRIKEQAKSGADPATDKRARQAADAAHRAMTVNRLLDIYAADLPKRPKMRGRGVPSATYVSTELAHLKAAVATMQAGDKPVGDLAPQHLRTLLRAEAARTAVARHRFGAVSRFLDWCLDEGHVRLNVCMQVGKSKRPKPPPARTRYLTPAEVAVLWTAADGMELAVHRDFARFLLAVPCRRIEAARMDWSQVGPGRRDVDAAQQADEERRPPSAAFACARIGRSALAARSGGQAVCGARVSVSESEGGADDVLRNQCRTRQALGPN